MWSVVWPLSCHLLALALCCLGRWWVVGSAWTGRDSAVDKGKGSLYACTLPQWVTSLVYLSCVFLWCVHLSKQGRPCTNGAESGVWQRMCVHVCMYIHVCVWVCVHFGIIHLQLNPLLWRVRSYVLTACMSVCSMDLQIVYCGPMPPSTECVRCIAQRLESEKTFRPTVSALTGYVCTYVHIHWSMHFHFIVQYLICSHWIISPTTVVIQ